MNKLSNMKMKVGQKNNTRDSMNILINNEEQVKKMSIRGNI